MNQLRFIRDTIYTLKREYGSPADIYAINGTSVNRETGERSQTKMVYRISRAILLPRNFTSDMIALLRGGRPLHHGAVTDRSNRSIIIDSQDYPDGYQPGSQDYVVIGLIRFNILKVQDYEHRLAISLDVEEIEGELPRQILEASAQHGLNLNSGGSGVK